MRRRLAKPLALVTLALAAAAVIVALPKQWRMTSVETIAADERLVARRIHFARGDAAFDATIVRFTRDHATAQLVDLASGQTLADVAEDATLAINAGYFDAAFAPLGLYRVDGRDVSPPLARPPLSGVVTIDAAGRLDVVARDDATVAAARSAFQAGPFLIDPGGVLGIRGDDGKLAERTAIACDDRAVVVIVTTPTTLAALATCLHDRPEAFGVSHVDRALNLDGGPSAGFVLRERGLTRASLPRGRIRSALAFVADR